MTSSFSARERHIPDFTLKQLAYLVEASDAGTIAEAAKRLHISSSAMSDAITELERGFEMRLCVRRRSQGFALTAEGRRVVRSARSILRDARALAGNPDDTELVGQIAIGCPQTLSTIVMPPLLSEFARSHPGVQLEFREAEQHDLRAALDVGDLDVAFVYDSPVHDTPQRLTVRELTPHAILPLGHRLAGNGTLALEELVDDDLILLDTAPTADRTIAMFSMLGLRAPVAYRTASIEAVRTLVGRGLGFAILAQRSASSMTTDGRQFVRVEITPAPTTMAVNMIWPQRSENSPHVRALKEFAADSGWRSGGVM